MHIKISHQIYLNSPSEPDDAADDINLIGGQFLGCVKGVVTADAQARRVAAHDVLYTFNDYAHAIM